MTEIELCSDVRYLQGSHVLGLQQFYFVPNNSTLRCYPQIPFLRRPSSLYSCAQTVAQSFFRFSVNPLHNPGSTKLNHAVKRSLANSAFCASSFDRTKRLCMHTSVHAARLVLRRVAASSSANVTHTLYPRSLTPACIRHARLLSSTTTSPGLLARFQRLVVSAVRSVPSTEDSDKTGEPRLPMSRLLEVAKQERKLIGFAMAAQLISASSTMIFPLAMGNIVDSVTGTSTTDLTTLAMLTGGIFAVSAVATATRTSAMSLAGSRISRTLRVSLFTSLLRQDTSFFDMRQSGELTNRLSSDVPQVARTLTDNLAKILRSAVTAGASLGFIVYLSPKLSMVTLCSLPPIGLFALIFGRNARRLSRSLVDALAAATQVAAERTSALRTVRYFGAEAVEARRYASRVDDTYELAKQVARADGIYAGSVQFAAQLSLLGVLWLGGSMVVDPTNPMTIGGLTSFSMYAVNLAVSVSGMGTAYGQLTRALGSGYRIFDIIDCPPSGKSSTISHVSDLEHLCNTDGPVHRDETGIILQPDYNATVHFNDVHFTYPARQESIVLNGVSLKVSPGEIVAIAGMSGSGKSTLSALLSRLYDPTGGDITLGGTSISQLDTAWLRSQIAVVSQEPVLFSGSIADNIAYALPGSITDDDIRAAAQAAASHDMITSLPAGYDTMVGERGTALSGGQRARTALSRALARNPRVLVLDEHSAALDAESERAVAHAVFDAAELRNMVVITIAHRTSSLKRAHRVAVLVDGRVVELDSYDVLMRRQDSHLRRMLVPPS